MSAPCPDVLIVGSGPSGSVLACLLADAGLQVELLERSAHPRPKPCGELLNPGAVRTLDRLGLLEPVLALHPATLKGWHLATEGGARAEGRYGPSRIGLSVARDRLDAALVAQAVTRGAVLHERVQVRRVRTARNGDLPTAETIEADGSARERRARVVVGADGLRSMVAAGINARRRRGTVRKVSLTCRVQGRLADAAFGRLHISDGGTVGASAVHADGHRFNVTVVADSHGAGRTISVDPLGFFHDRLERAGLDWLEAPHVVDGPWASGPFDRPIREIVHDGVLLVGDAAGYYDPLTGQGLFRAFCGAELAAAQLIDRLRAGHRSPTRAELDPYARRLRRAFRSGRGVQRVVEAVVSREGPRRRAIRGLAGSARSADRLLRFTGDIAPIHSLVRPSFLAAVAGLETSR